MTLLQTEKQQILELWVCLNLSNAWPWSEIIEWPPPLAPLFYKRNSLSIFLHVRAKNRRVSVRHTYSTCLAAVGRHKNLLFGMQGKNRSQINCIIYLESVLYVCIYTLTDCFIASFVDTNSVIFRQGYFACYLFDIRRILPPMITKKRDTV